MFEHAASIGYDMTLLDIGGGYPGADRMELFKEMADAINESLHTHFNRKLRPNLKIIAEPGKLSSLIEIGSKLTV